MFYIFIHNYFEKPSVESNKSVIIIIIIIIIIIKETVIKRRISIDKRGCCIDA